MSSAMNGTANWSSELERNQMLVSVFKVETDDEDNHEEETFEVKTNDDEYKKEMKVEDKGVKRSEKRATKSTEKVKKRLYSIARDWEQRSVRRGGKDENKDKIHIKFGVNGFKIRGQRRKAERKRHNNTRMGKRTNVCMAGGQKSTDMGCVRYDRIDKGVGEQRK